MTFRVGQKIVCVDNNWVLNRTVDLPNTMPQIGRVYTIRNFQRDESRGWVWLRLNEIVLPRKDIPPYGQLEPAFMLKHFRPLVERKTDISIFTAMLTPSPERVS